MYIYIYGTVYLWNDFLFASFLDSVEGSAKWLFQALQLRCEGVLCLLLPVNLQGLDSLYLLPDECYSIILWQQS